MFETANELIDLKLLKKKLEGELRILKVNIEENEAILKEHFIESGLQSMVVNGQNLILTEKKFATPDQSPEIVDWLTEHGHNHVFSKPINSNSFSSLFSKELTDKEKDEIGDMVTTGSKFNFQMRKK